MDLLVLADRNGVVDMTHEAIARRTNRPIEIIRQTISDLESADPRSRSPEFAGARLKRLDDHRDWGWLIVNYEFFREIASEEQRREKTLERVRKHRGKKALPKAKKVKRPVTLCNDFPYASASASAYASFPEGFKEEWHHFVEHRKIKKAPMTEHAQELFLKTLSKRPAQAIDALEMAIMRNWTGFKWEWFDNENQKAQAGVSNRPSPAKSRAERDWEELQERKRKMGIPK